MYTSLKKLMQVNDIVMLTLIIIKKLMIINIIYHFLIFSIIILNSH